LELELIFLEHQRSLGDFPVYTNYRLRNPGGGKRGREGEREREPIFKTAVSIWTFRNWIYN